MSGSAASFASGNLRLWDALAESTVTIVSPGDGGLYRLTLNTLLGRALIAHRPGDIVQVPTEACTVEYEIVTVARVAERQTRRS